MYLIDSQDWDVSKGVQVNVFNDTMVKDEGSVVVRNGHLAKRSPQGGPAETAGAALALKTFVKLGGLGVKGLYKGLFKVIYPPTLKIIGPPLFKKIYPPIYKSLLKAYVKKVPKVALLGTKAVKNSAIVPLGTILGSATIGAGAIGASTLGTGAILGAGAIPLGAGVLGAGTLGAATLGAGALGTAAVAGTAGVAGMWCITKTYSNFILCQISNNTI